MLASTNNFHFWSKFLVKGKLPVKKKKKKKDHCLILHIRISQVPTFSLNWQLRFCGSNLLKKGCYFQSKTYKIDTTSEFCIFKLVFVSNFTLN